MLRYTVVRASQGVATLLLVSAAIFVLLRGLGDPVFHLLPVGASSADYERLRHAYGYDLPLSVQYANFVAGLLRLNFGDSITYGVPASTLLLSRLPITLTIGVPALVIGFCVGISAGLLAGYRPNSRIDRAALLLATSGQAIPGFVLALALIYLFAVSLHVLPAGGNQGWTSFVLPVATVAIAVMSTLIRLTRSATRDVLEQPYILMARAKGLSEMRVLLDHALVNTLAPVLAYAGLLLGFLFTGAVITETVFALPGVGLTTLQAVQDQDLNVVQTSVMMGAVVFVSVTFLVDALYMVIDPRVRPWKKRSA
jgi:ABC-type dipeptide/oligopeptide/nickel transport system permease component